MFLGILTLFVAFCISGIAAYYSIIGLTAIFAAAFLPIVLMGSVLEVGKILTTIWLHQNWQRSPKIIRAYLTSAVIVLMFITSMGVFGFLSKSHIEQSAVGKEQLAQQQTIDDKIFRSENKQKRWQEEINRLNSGQDSGRIDALIKREQQRITDANERLKPQIDAENAKIPGLRAQADKEIAQQSRRLGDAQKRSSAAIKVAQDELDRLDKDVDAYTKQGTGPSGFLSGGKDNVRLGAELRKQQAPERNKLQKDIDRAKAGELSVASGVQREIRAINSRLNESIKRVEQRITEIRKTVDPTVKSANENIAKYTLQAGSANKTVDVRIKELEEFIEKEQPTIDALREDRLVFEKQYRQFEAEVGPVKYIAELVYGDASRGLLEEAVRWVIIIIVAVFDPLAVCLVLAGTMTIGWWHRDRRQKLERVDREQIKELEMKLEQHNDILTELEKLLDDNLGKMDPAEYAKLKAEYDAIALERDALAQALDDAKEEGDDLIEKVVATEQERDTLAARLEEIQSGSEGFKTRVEELLNQVEQLEAEVERRDAVVMKIAEKYQLVEKDEFGASLVADANGDGVPDIFQDEEFDISEYTDDDQEEKKTTRTRKK